MAGYFVKMLFAAPIKTGEVQRVRVPYGEGLASHTGPESCLASREVGGEALTGETCRLGIEPRKVSCTSGCRRREQDGRQHQVCR